MSNIDERIIEAVLGKPLDPNMPIPNFVEKIKQCFADEGYKFQPNLKELAGYTINTKPTMTGAEWYDRFIKELDSLPEAITPGLFKETGINKAAKRASGVSND